MSKSFFKSLLPHIIAVVIFAIVAIVYAKPALEGKVLQQVILPNGKGWHKMPFRSKKNMAISRFGAIACLVECPDIKSQERQGLNIQ